MILYADSIRQVHLKPNFSAGASWFSWITGDKNERLEPRPNMRLGVMILRRLSLCFPGEAVRRVTVRCSPTGE